MKTWVAVCLNVDCRQFLNHRQDFVGPVLSNCPLRNVETVARSWWRIVNSRFSVSHLLKTGRQLTSLSLWKQDGQILHCNALLR